MLHAESQFQQAIVKYLRIMNIFCFSVPNGQKLKITQAIKAKNEGLTAGVSDLIILLPNGKTVFVEIKNPNGKGRQSDSQKQFEQKVKSLGFEYYIWSSWKQVEAFVDGLKVERLKG